MEYYAIIKTALRKIYSNAEKCFYQSSCEKYRIQDLMYTVVTIILGRFFWSAYPLGLAKNWTLPHTVSTEAAVCERTRIYTHAMHTCTGDGW